MKKNVNFTIGGIIFHIEENGSGQLKKFLDDIKYYYSSSEDCIEIIADIETRIAEIFLSKLQYGKQLITLEDVEFLTYDFLEHQSTLIRC